MKQEGRTSRTVAKESGLPRPFRLRGPLKQSGGLFYYELLMPPPDVAFQRALRAARDAGWDIVESRPDQGRIEATDTTLWFGFKDDIVVRVTPQDSASRIDVRSVSRVGKSDVGTNAARIRNYLLKIQRTES
jgi:hypothetical protein